ncbi:MAG: TonB-dependent receptor [Duncaniella sp.]|nr:TonB-dependent receptor [Duncaniella sp.]
MRNNRFLSIIFAIASALYSSAEEPADTLDLQLEEVTVSERISVSKLRGTATNTENVSAFELKRAACCNLGESFTTNPSVDVSYSDAATGARQIRLLGLSGTYVQMLTENVPSFRGAASPYGLGYVAGPWLQSIQISKGASSVKNGYESITGQINVELKKPQADPSLTVNGYADAMGKAEVNFDGNLRLSRRLSAGLLVHGEHSFASHDTNEDGFVDKPLVSQLAAMNRWAYLGDRYIFQGALKQIVEKRRSGQIGHHAHFTNPYVIDIRTARTELFTKNAYIIDPESDTNVALIASGSFHDMRSDFGLRLYDVRQLEGYLSAMFERKWTPLHALSAGLSLVCDNLDQHWRNRPDPDLVPTWRPEHELTPGVYGQYTFNLDNRLIAMGGLRLDHSSKYGFMLTPRLHVRFTPADLISLQVSAGRGWHTPHPLAEFHYMMASSRNIVIAKDLKAESAWNFGTSLTSKFRLADRKVSLGAEYYYTRFRSQLLLDLDTSPFEAIIRSSDGPSYSHTFQLEGNIEIIEDLSFTAAWRLTDVKANYGQGMVSKPLTPRSKTLFTLGWTPDMGLWQVDITCAITGSGRNPTPYLLGDGTASWSATYHPFATLNAQLTRNFRHWSIYIGGENLTAYHQRNPIIGASNPWGPNFDATLIHAPVDGAMFYVGFRYNFTKYL